MNVIVYTDDTRDAVEVNENMLCLLVLTSPDYPTAQGDVLHLCQGNGKQQVSFCQFYTTMSYIPTYEVLLDMVAMIDPYHSMEMTSLCEPKMRQLLSLGPDLASTKMQMVSNNIVLILINLHSPLTKNTTNRCHIINRMKRLHCCGRLI